MCAYLLLHNIVPFKHFKCISEHFIRKLGCTFTSFFLGGLHLWHMEFPRLGVRLELRLVAYATATAMPEPSRICNLHHSSQQHQILLIH